LELDMARRVARAVALVLAALLSARADWLATHTADEASAAELQGKLLEQFGKKIDGFHRSPVESFYWADGPTRAEHEVRILLDSEVPFVELRRTVESLHPYKLPMIVSTAHGGPLIANNIERYLMGTVDINQTTATEAGMLAKELVQVRYAACSHVEEAEDAAADTYRVTVKTTASGRKHISREFGGLDFEWTPLQGNRPFLDWLETSVSSGSEL